MMPKTLALLPLALALSAGDAGAEVMTFESLYRDDAQVHDAGFLFAEAGFRVVNLGTYPFASYGAQAPEFSGSTALFNDNDDGLTVLDSVGGDLFHLLSIDLAEMILSAADEYRVTFVAVHLGGAESVQSFVLDGLPGAETFTFGPQFTWLRQVRWSNAAPYHQFDNIEVAVPAPGPLTLLIAGLALGWPLTRRWSPAA